MKDVQQQAEQLKKLLELKGNQYSLQAAKDIMVGAANKTKELKDEIKECIGLANQSWFQGINQEVNVLQSSPQPLLKGFFDTPCSKVGFAAILA